MFRPRKAIFLGLALVSANAFATEYKQGEVIVKYKDSDVRGNELLRSRKSMNALFSTVGVKKVRHYSGVMSNFDHLILNNDTTVEEAIQKLKKNNLVEYAQPNYILHALPVRIHADQTISERPKGEPCWFPGIEFPPGCDMSGTPTNPPTDPGQPATPPVASRPDLKNPPAEVNPPVEDPALSKAWGLTKIGATEAWKTWRGDPNFVVADIDTGIDYNGVDLALNVWRNPHPSEKNDIVGYDFVHDDGLPFDDQDHGTHTAGTIGAVGGNGVGISGVIQRVSIMAVKFLSAEGSGTTADAIRSIDYAVEHGAKILNNSWGGPGDDGNPALHDAIDRARAKDVLFIAAAGNDGEDNDGASASYPAAFDNDNLITVAATDRNDRLAGFSNIGKKTTHLAAPGVRIYSTLPGDKYAYLDGTSMACPHVTGAAALVWSRHPEWDYKKVKDVLLSSVDPVDGLADKTITGGRLNVLKALNSN